MFTPVLTRSLFPYLAEEYSIQGFGQDGRRTVYHVYRCVSRLVCPFSQTKHQHKRRRRILISLHDSSFSFTIYLLLTTCIGVQLRRSDIWEAVVHNSRGAREARARRSAAAAAVRNGRGARAAAAGEEYEMVPTFEGAFGGAAAGVGRDQWTRKGF